MVVVVAVMDVVVIDVDCGVLSNGMRAGARRGVGVEVRAGLRCFTPDCR